MRAFVILEKKNDKDKAPSVDKIGDKKLINHVDLWHVQYAQAKVCSYAKITEVSLLHSCQFHAQYFSERVRPCDQTTLDLMTNMLRTGSVTASAG